MGAQGDVGGRKKGRSRYGERLAFVCLGLEQRGLGRAEGGAKKGVAPRQLASPLAASVPVASVRSS